MTRIAPPSGPSSGPQLLLAVGVLAGTVAALLWPVVSGERVLVAGDFFKVWPPWSAQWADGTLPHNTDLSDNVLYYLPSRAYAAEAIRAGRIPLWNPHILGGTPFLANGESGVFSPLSALFLWLRAPVAIGYTAALQLVLAGAFFYLLMRDLGLRLPASLFGAVVFMLNGFFIVWLEMLNLVGVALWIPLAVLGVKRWLERTTPAAALALTGLLAVQFLVGFLHMSLYLLMAAFGYAVFHVLRRLEPLTARRMAWAVGSLSAMTLAGAALAAVQLWPHLELIGLCQRDATPVTWPLANWEHFRHLITLVRPDHFGSPVGHTYRGAPNYTELCGYVGALPLVVALFGARPRAHVATPYFVATAVAALLLYLETPLHSLLLALVPGYRLGIGSTRAIVLFTFATAALAAIGFEGLIGTTPRRTARSVLGAVVFLLSLGELLRFGTRHLTTVDEALVYPPAPAIDFLKGVPGPWRMTSTPGVFPPNSAMAYGLEDADGYESLFPRRYAEYLGLADQHLLADPSSPGTTVPRVGSPLLDPLNVRFVITDLHLPDQGFSLRYEDAAVRIYERARALPRAFVVWRFRTLEGGPAVLAALRSAEFHPAEEVLLETDPGLAGMGGTGQAQVAIVAHEPERVVIRASLSQPGLLVLADTYYPGWEVRVGGRERPLLVADYVLRAVALERGDHQVEFVFRPRSLRLGGALSVIALLILGAGTLTWLRRMAVRPLG